jgi:L-aminopeptidase/D-esterase-like protein
MNRQARREAERALRRAPRPARKAKPRIDPIAMAVAGVQPLSKEQIDQLAVRTHGAMSNIVRGLGTNQDAAALAAMANVTLVLVEFTAAGIKRDDPAAEQHHSAALDALDTVKAAQAALLELQARAETCGYYSPTTPEVQQLNACIELHDEFMKLAPVHMIERAHRTAIGRAHAGHVAQHSTHLT